MFPAKIKVGLFLDGRIGHEKQSRGLIKALKEIIDVDVVEYNIPHLGNLDYLSTLIRYKFQQISVNKINKYQNADLLIGVGRQTHLPMLSAKRQLGTKVITCMDPGFIVRKDFDLCFIPNHDSVPETENSVLTFGPPNTSINLKQHELDKGLILVGGIDEKSHHWDNSRLLEQIGSIVNNNGDITWSISSSPRTPVETISSLKKYVSTVANVNFYHYLDTENDWLEKQYNLNKYVWVTADSISMVFEALSAGCDVGMIPVSWKRKNSKFQRCENLLLNSNYVQLLGPSLNDSIEKPILDEAQRCARIILERLWTKN